MMVIDIRYAYLTTGAFIVAAGNLAISGDYIGAFICSAFSILWSVLTYKGQKFWNRMKDIPAADYAYFMDMADGPPNGK